MRTVKNRVLVKIMNQNEQKHGSIFLAGELHTPVKKGTVISCGPDVKSLKCDDVVMFENLMGVQIEKTDEYTILSLSEDNIVAVE